MTTKTKSPDLKKAANEISLDKTTLAGVARKAILSGRTNAEVIEALHKAFPKFPHRKHAYYATWYRAQLVMKGIITRAWARAHSGAAAGHEEESSAHA